MYKILNVHSITDINDKILYYRANRAHGGRSQTFIVMMEEEEAGFLSYEDWSEEYIGFIYEIYVLPQFRNRGVGKLLLSYAEGKASELNCRYIRLKPYPLDERTDKDSLIAWYEKEGYFLKGEELEIMEKDLHTIII